MIDVKYVVTNNKIIIATSLFPNAPASNMNNE